MTLRTNGPGGSLVTYAQNREDLYLFALIGDRSSGTYVDVGCNHERLHSVTRLFYELGWSGIDIDANPSFAHEYATRRPRDRFVNAGIGEAVGTLTFRVYPDQDGLSTFDTDTQAVHAEAYVHRDVEIPVRTLADVLAESDITRVDFLKIDVEGLEGAVLRGLDLDIVRPSVVVVEAARQPESDAVLLTVGYRKEFFDGLNLYYISPEDPDVSIHNYAGRVLMRPIHTAREIELLEARPPLAKLADGGRQLVRRSAGYARGAVGRVRHRP